VAAHAETDSGIEIKPAYGPADLDGWDPLEQLGEPGKPPYTRGVRPTIRRESPWTIRPYSGFGTAKATNERWKYLLANGSTGLSCAFDLPTQIGYDSDSPRAEGEVGKVGVAIDSIEDMRELLDGMPLDKVTTSMTINSTAPILLLLYELVAEEQGVPSAGIAGGTVQNDLLKEYIARGTYIYPPRPSMRLITDLFAYCTEHIPTWNTISISGYHIREAGSTAVQEIAFTLANAIAYVEAATKAGLDVNAFGQRLSFFFNAHNNFLEEIAKFRAARRLWARLMRDRFGATNPRAQQPEVNIARTAIEALAGVLGGTQSLHTNSFDEALALPTEKAARIALRTQQVIAHETGETNVADPLGGSWFVEALTDEIERQAEDIFAKVDEMGGGSMLEGAYVGIDNGYFQAEIADAAFQFEKLVNRGERIVVGVNAFTDGTDESQPDLLQITQESEMSQIKRLQAVRADRDGAAVEAALARLKGQAADPEVNLMPALIDVVGTYATEGEIMDTLAEVFGRYVERPVI
jgi:methylmalonyl-CoA mutase N-terminal domain/subunit